MFGFASFHQEKWQNDPVRKDAWMQELQAFDARSIVAIIHNSSFPINLNVGVGQPKILE